MADKELSVEEIDRILIELEKSLDITSLGEGVSILEIQKGEKLPSSSDKSLLRFECPAAIWDEFADYCKRNELDPAQQIREAVICYYKNLWETYRIRKKIHNDSELV